MTNLSLTHSVISILLGIVLLPKQNSAQALSTSQKIPIEVKRITSNITLDGISNEKAWEEIEPLQLVMMAPTFGEKPSERTEVKIGYDDNYLYVSAKLFDNEPSKIQAPSFKRDYWDYNADLFGILIDAFNDHENANIFVTTPAGTRTDINFLNDALGAPYYNMNKSWNTFWDAVTVTKDDGWYTEIRIPFSSLRFEINDNETIMGITVIRWIARKFEIDTYPPIPEKLGGWGAYKPSKTYPFIFEGLKKKNPIYITPYVLAGLGQNNELNEAKTGYSKKNKNKRDVGLDVKYGLTNNLTLDLTINTDFAQVEADEQMINLTRYSLYFPEKRLFFQERQGNFDFSFEEYNRLFYSRRIGIHNNELVKIYGGARLVGRLGDWDVGFLNMQTEKYETLPSENFSVLRLKKQVINPESHIGGMFTSRIGNGDIWNIAYGLDGLFKVLDDDYLTIKWAQTFQNDKQNQIFNFAPSKFYINWNKRIISGFGYNLSYSRAGNNFNPGIGYERYYDYTRLGDEIFYGWIPKGNSKLHNHRLYLAGIYIFSNSRKKIESASLAPGWKFGTKNGASGSIELVHSIEAVEKQFSISSTTNIPEGDYKFFHIKSTYATPQGNRFKISTNFDMGAFYDGNKITWSFSPKASFSKYIQVDGSYTIDIIKFKERNQNFTGHIGEIKLHTYLNSKLELVSIAQYNSAVKKVFTNFRFRFNPKEGHDLYIVYDNNFNTDRYRTTPVLPTSIVSTILVKYSYTFKIGL